MTAPPALRFDAVRFVYADGQPAVRGASLVIEAGECTALVGPNGAGKTTLLALAAGLLAPTEGRIEFDGSASRPPAGNVGLVFQDPDDQLFMPSVFDDVAFGPRNLGLDESRVATRVAGALQAVGMEGFQERHPHHLSGGEKRLAALAAVLSMEPRILALDEPTAELDHRARRRLIEWLAGRHETRLIATHDLEMALDLCGRVILLDRGDIVTEGPAAELLSNRALLEAHGLEVPWSLRTEHRHGVMPPGDHHAQHHRLGLPHTHGHDE